MLARISGHIPTVARFIVSSSIATSLHWGLMALLLALGAGAGIATAVGAALGAIGNYFLQWHFTFLSRVDHRHAMPAFAAAAGLAWLANLFIFNALHAWLGLAIVSAQGLTTLSVAFLTFTLYKKVVFHERATSIAVS